MALELRCANCRVEIAPDYWNDPAGTGCRGCTEPVNVRVFAAMFRSVEAALPDRVGAEGEASCFYHPDNRASVTCDDCGRFLCSLCEIPAEGRRVCPACLEKGPAGQPGTEDQRVLYDSIALHLSTWPILTVWFPMFTAPMALYYAIRHWRVPPLVVPRRWRLRMAIALIFSLSQVIGLLAFTGFVMWAVVGGAK